MIDILNRFKEDTEMTEQEFVNLCKRYFNRDKTTLYWYLKDLYGDKLNYHSIAKFSKDINKQMENILLRK